MICAFWIHLTSICLPLCYVLSVAVEIVCVCLLTLPLVGFYIYMSPWAASFLSVYMHVLNCNQYGLHSQCFTNACPQSQSELGSTDFKCAFSLFVNLQKELKVHFENWENGPEVALKFTWNVTCFILMFCCIWSGCYVCDRFMVGRISLGFLARTRKLSVGFRLSA